MDTKSGITIGRKGTGLSPFVQVFGPNVMDSRISDGAYRTLHLLDLLSGADREGRHRVELIAKLRGVKVRMLQYHLKELKESGLIEVEHDAGETNRILIVEPLDVYGRAAIGGFYAEVQRASKELYPRGGAKNCTTPPQKIAPPPLQKIAPPLTPENDAIPYGDKELRNEIENGVEYRGVEVLEHSPTGAGSHLPSNLLPGNEAAGECAALPVTEHGGGTPGTPQDAPAAAEGQDASGDPKAATEGQAGAVPTVSGAPPKPEGTGGVGEGGNIVPKAHTMCGGSCKVMPWEKEEEESGRRPKKPRKSGLYDPSKPVSEWNGNDLVGYFREGFKRTWPGEGAPDVRIEDLGAAKRRIVWMRDEGIDLALAKRAVDYLFENWKDGLPGRLRWKGSRPGIAIIGTARLFEMVVREVQNGPGGSVKVDDWKGETPEVKKHEERERIRARLLNEGATLEQATREANRLAGL